MYLKLLPIVSREYFQTSIMLQCETAKQASGYLDEHADAYRRSLCIYVGLSACADFPICHEIYANLAFLVSKLRLSICLAAAIRLIVLCF